MSGQAARIAIEVRSKLTAGPPNLINGSKGSKKQSLSGLDQMFKVCKSMRNFPTQVFGFAFIGVKFDDFVEAVASRVDGDIFNVPECITVHSLNYLCVRVTEKLAKPNQPRPNPRLCIAIDLSQSKVDRSGLATAYFLSLYIARVKKEPPFAIETFGLLARDLQIPDAAIRIIDENGQITAGPIPI